MAFIGKGAILQVKQTLKHGALSGTVASGSFVAFDSTFNVSITPQYSSSLILIGGHVVATCSGGDQGIKIVIRRDSSTLGTALDGSTVGDVIGASAGNNISRATASGLIHNHGAESFPLCYVDKPNSTSALSYSVALGTTSGVSRDVYINMLNGESNSAQWSRFCSIMYAMELAQ
jgi:hypothetical protein|tara:strand:- start:332 stop:856 length:525 start_codon:yes stop_codon:yes gene_type:complete